MTVDKIIVEINKNSFTIYTVTQSTKKNPHKVLEFKHYSSILTTNDTYEILLKILKKIDWVLGREIKF